MTFSNNSMTTLVAKRWQSLLMVVICAVMAGALTSCEEDDYPDPYESYVYGNWELIAINGGPVPQYMDSYFTFSPSGYGTMSQYDQYGMWATYDITWEMVGNYLYVKPIGWVDLWTYTWSAQDDYLYLYDTSTGNTLTYVYYY